MSTPPNVFFFYEVRHFRFEERTRTKRFIESIFRREKKKLAAINYIFVSDKRLLEINRQYLQHDFYTDIITFDLSEGAATQAEVYISIDRVRENARTLNQPFRTELLRVIFHGALHCCGYGDKTRADEMTMRKKEDQYLHLFG